MIVRKEDNATLGTIDLTDFDPHNLRAGIGILIDNEFRAQGYASQAIELLKDYAFQFLHLKQIYAHIPTTSQASLKTFNKAGFQQTGIMKNWIRHINDFIDVEMWQYINE